jgi:hypothetical protein
MFNIILPAVTPRKIPAESEPPSEPPTRTLRASVGFGFYPGANPYATGSFTPSDNSLLVAIVTGGLEYCYPASVQASITLAGGGLTWTLRAAVPTNDSGGQADNMCLIYTAPVTTGASMTVSVDRGSDQFWPVAIHVIDYTGYNVSTPIGLVSTGVSAYNENTTALSPMTISLGGTSESTSEILAVGWANHTTTAIATGSGWTQLYSLVSDEFRTHIQARQGALSDAEWATFPRGWQRAAVAMEIRAA